MVLLQIQDLAPLPWKRRMSKLTQPEMKKSKVVMGRLPYMLFSMLMLLMIWYRMTIPYLKIDDESLGMHRSPVAALTPLSTPTEETVLLPPASPGNERLCREIPAVELESIDASTPDYSDVPLVRFTRPDLSPVFPWVKLEAQNMGEPPWRMELAQIQKDEEV